MKKTARSNLKVALITGPARGIGEGVARALHARGYAVVLVGLEAERLNEIACDLGSETALACEADVTDSDALSRAVSTCMETFGRLDVVVANAGIANYGNFASTHVDDLARVVEVNLVGVIRTMKACYQPLVDSRGYALLISSASAFPALPGITAYGSSKAGVDHFGNNLRVELAPYGVDVGVAYPSWVDTDLVRDQFEELPYFRQALEAEPHFFGKVTSLDECVAILVEGIAGRKRRIFVPENITWLHAFRSVAVSRLWEMGIGFFAKKMLPEMAEEAREVGRAFGKHSVENRRAPAEGKK